MGDAEGFGAEALEAAGVEDRTIGALVGLAVGDALGTTLEFKARDTFEPLTDMVGGGPFGLRPGQWTDDTSMALCIAASLIETGGLDLRDQLDRFVRWESRGYMSSTGTCFDIGNQTASALNAYQRTGEVPDLDLTETSSGNGSLMRLAPIPMAFASDPALAEETSRASSLTTHPSLECVEACGAYGRMIAEAIQGYSKQQILDSNRAAAPDCAAPKVRGILEGDYRQKTREQISSSGYVISTMEAALWAFMATDSFRAGALLAVNLGDDADTVGAVYGQLAGAFYGLSGIPEEWVSTLYWSEEIIAMARSLYDAQRGHP